MKITNSDDPRKLTKDQVRQLLRTPGTHFQHQQELRDTPDTFRVISNRGHTGYTTLSEEQNKQDNSGEEFWIQEWREGKVVFLEGELILRPMAGGS